jgi:2-oxoisovalerate dehydrogenase E1 component
MQRAGQGFYTIGSSGHEGMAAVAQALRPGDMAFLHYRDAAFQIARSRQVPGQARAAWPQRLVLADRPAAHQQHRPKTAAPLQKPVLPLPGWPRP